MIGPYCSIDAKPDAQQPRSGGKKKKKKGSLGESFSGEAGALRERWGQYRWAVPLVSLVVPSLAPPLLALSPQPPGADHAPNLPLPLSRFAVIRSSPKIMNLAMLVVSYGVSHRLFEFAWKGQLRVLYPTPQAYQSVLADVSIATGWATIAFMLLVSGRRERGWRVPRV